MRQVRVHRNKLLCRWSVATLTDVDFPEEIHLRDVKFDVRRGDRKAPGEPCRSRAVALGEIEQADLRPRDAIWIQVEFSKALDEFIRLDTGKPINTARHIHCRTDGSCWAVEPV